jgi:pyruvate/2-oxoglutarate/acetoin dehydrogenase E1 component
MGEPCRCRLRCASRSASPVDLDRNIRKAHRPCLLARPDFILPCRLHLADAKGMLKTAIRDNNPVLFFEHKALYDLRDEVPAGDHLVPIGKGDIKRPGKDITVIATAFLVHTALKVATQMAGENVDIELIDPRWLAPLDEDMILESVRKTGRVLIVHEEAKTGGSGAEIAAMIAEKALFDLRAPIQRLASPDVPIAQSTHLEQFYRPTEHDISAAARALMKFN